MDIPFNYMVLLFFMLVTAAVVTVIAVVSKKLIAGRRKLQPSANPDAMSADEKAFSLLDKLTRENLLKQGLYKEYYSRLSDILREYLEERFEYSAMDRTTQEISRALKINEGENGAVRSCAGCPGKF